MMPTSEGEFLTRGHAEKALRPLTDLLESHGEQIRTLRADVQALKIVSISMMVLIIALSILVVIQ